MLSEFENCQFFVQRKSRYCRMTVKKGNKYCGEHMEIPLGSLRNIVRSNAERVPCPLDNTHTCYAKRLARHLKVCNVQKLRDSNPAYIVNGINRRGNQDCSKHIPLSILDRNIIDAVIKKIEIAHDQLPMVESLILNHEIVDAEVNNLSYGKDKKKHLLQNSSLLAHIDRAGLTRDDTCYIDFGAGKGKLTYWLAQMVKNKRNSAILLVDRSSHRHKNDNRLRNEKCSVNVIRIRADIADLSLCKIDQIKSMKNKVGVAKHLCGAATDLTVRCLSKLMQDENTSLVTGLVIAFCCHHRCEYTSYVGKEYLKSCNFSPEDFPILCSIASWATCGFGKSKSDMDSPEAENNQSPMVKKKLIGNKVKYLLNWGRMKYLENLGFECRLYFYTTAEISLENMCVVAKLTENV